MNHIDYQKIANALRFYKTQYKHIEVPWWVTKEISGITRPTFADDYVLSVNDKVLVASGEQSFLSLINKGYLPAGKYMAVTPCFRNESYDFLHSKHFVKLELIEFSAQIKDPEHTVNSTASFALDFFASEMVKDGKDPSLLKIVKTQDGLDIVLCHEQGDIELGSYGYRTCQFCSWVYGTGLAEPRFSKAINCAKSS